MDPVDVLIDEHEVIRRVIEALEALTARAEATGRLDAAPARQALEFLAEFADHLHHQREEEHLFPILEARGVAREGGPTGELINEHEEARYHRRSLAEALEGAAQADPFHMRKWSEHVRDLAALLRGHMRREENGIFPMIGIAMTPEDRQRLAEEFQAADPALDRRGRDLAAALTAATTTEGK